MVSIATLYSPEYTRELHDGLASVYRGHTWKYDYAESIEHTTITCYVDGDEKTGHLMLIINPNEINLTIAHKALGFATYRVAERYYDDFSPNVAFGIIHAFLKE